MDIVQAKEIVEMLADGIDPVTGEVFPPESCYNNPAIIRALFTILRPVRTPTKTQKKSTREKQDDNISNEKPKNAGFPWTEELKNEIASLFNQGQSIRYLASYFGRTSGAIKSELRHQGLISP